MKDKEQPHKIVDISYKNEDGEWETLKNIEAGSITMPDYNEKVPNMRLLHGFSGVFNLVVLVEETGKKYKFNGEKWEEEL